MRGVDSFGMATRHPRRWEGQNKTPPADRIPPAAGEPPRCPCHLAVGHLPCYGRAAAHCGGNQHRRRPEPPRRERAPHRSPPAATAAVQIAATAATAVTAAAAAAAAIVVWQRPPLLQRRRQQTTVVGGCYPWALAPPSPSPSRPRPRPPSPPRRRAARVGSWPPLCGALQGSAGPVAAAAPADAVAPCCH
ncbi:hypothetical protein I4F81_009273 [Pyropia yezoensis]|uniref:Uncharacterized protein n=1 Tax=Pyropia yezoensis TaxID=2788 RepID=A0ACC3CA42_PYRYE|nr:hypothetical protein I4F81_009273 [Neopyropia yezoensis]